MRPLHSVKAAAEVIYPARPCRSFTGVDSSHRILAVLTGCEIQNMTLIVHDRAPEYRRRIAHERGQRYEDRDFTKIVIS